MEKWDIVKCLVTELDVVRGKFYVVHGNSSSWVIVTDDVNELHCLYRREFEILNEDEGDVEFGFDEEEIVGNMREWRKTFHNKFKNQETFWEMYDKELYKQLTK
jgi:hypothetical protein